ncbi:MAG: DNA-3-methyladenine glycosylase family protein [Fusobacteriaceae bacterium]
MQFFQYDDVALEYLKKRDKKLKKIIEEVGEIKRAIIPDIFEALIDSIIGQQISMKAAITVRKRFDEVIGGRPTPEKILSANPDEIQKCGMSIRKAEYLIGVARAAKEKVIDFKKISKRSDEEIIEQLSSLHGVGVWTAEMLLIFSLNRMDVLSYGDFAIRKGIMKIYEKESITKKEFEEYRKKYSPYSSVASLYIWHASQM